VQPDSAIPTATAGLVTSLTIPSVSLSVGQIMGGVGATRSAEFKSLNVMDSVTLSATSTVKTLPWVSGYTLWREAFKV